MLLPVLFILLYTIQTEILRYLNNTDKEKNNYPASETNFSKNQFHWLHSLFYSLKRETVNHLLTGFIYIDLQKHKTPK